MAQGLLVCWKERRDEVVVVEQAHSLSWWTSVSSPIYAPLLAKGLLCGLCHVALSAVTRQSAAKPVPDWSQWSAGRRVGWGQVGVARREHRALSVLPTLSPRPAS